MRHRHAHSACAVWLTGAILVGLASSATAMETLALSRTLDSSGSTTDSTTFAVAATVSNGASLTGDVAVFASFSAQPAGGQGGRAGEWQLVAGGQQSTIISRDMSDASNDFGVINVAWTFTALVPGATVTLQHRTSNGLRISTSDISLVAIPLTTEPTGAVPVHDLDDQGSFTFTSASTGFVPVESSADVSLVATVEIYPLSVPSDLFLAATFSTSKPVVGDADGSWKLQFNEVNSPPAVECQDGVDVGTTVQRSLSGNNDIGALVIYAIAEDLVPGTYEVRLCTASPSGASIDTFGAALVAFALHYSDMGIAGHFPRIQGTVATAAVTGGNMEPIPGLVDPFTLDETTDVFLAMSFTSLSAAGGAGDFGEFETCIEAADSTYPFGRDQNGTSQEVRRRFASSNDRGVGGQVGLALGLPTGSYNARGCASVTGNPLTLENPNLVGFVPRSIDDATVPVTLAWVRSRRDGGELEWATATEVGNLGFHVWGLEESRPRRLNDSLIPSQAVDPAAPTFYRFGASGFGGEAWLLEDVDLTGRSRFHGPFRSGSAQGRRPTPRSTPWERIRGRRLAASEPAGRDRSRVRDSTARPGRPARVNLSVESDGVHRLTFEQLLGAGIDLSGTPASRLRLESRSGPVPIHVGGPPRFGAGSYIEFVGQAIDTLYTNSNVYVLGAAAGASPRVGRDPAAAPAGRPAAWYTETRRVEVNRRYDFSSTGESPWYDTGLLAVSGPVEATFDLEIEAIERGAGPVELTVALWGATDFPQAPDHHVVAEVNGVEVAEAWFDGLTYHPIELEIPDSLLEPSGNALRLRLPHDSGSDFDLVNYDHYEVRYPRRFEAVGGRLRFTSAAPLFRVDELPSSEVLVYRVTEAATELLEGLEISGLPGAYSVTFRGSDEAATYYVSTLDGLHVPTVAEAARPVEPSDDQVDLLIISHPDFLDGLEPLAEARRNEGFRVWIVDVEGIYQRFAGGVLDPEAIREFLRLAHRHMGTRYVLLVGGDTYDYHGYLDTGSISFLPTLYAPTDRIVRYAPVDPLYGDVDGDGVPDLAIGRLPARDPAELDILIAKTLDYGARSGPLRAVAAADAYDLLSNTSFTELSDALVGNLSEAWEIERAYIDDVGLEAARRILIDSFDEGVTLASYFGHSGPDVWSFEGLFDIEDAEALGNAGRHVMVTQFGCWNTYFVSPTYDTLAHALLLSGDRGAAAVLGATTLTQIASEKALGARFFAALTEPGITVGAALRNAKRELATVRPDLADVLLGWTLLGDPTLVLEP